MNDYPFPSMQHAFFISMNIPSPPCYTQARFEVLGEGHEDIGRVGNNGEYGEGVGHIAVGDWDGLGDECF